MMTTKAGRKLDYFGLPPQQSMGLLCLPTPIYRLNSKLPSEKFLVALALIENKPKCSIYST